MRLTTVALAIAIVAAVVVPGPAASAAVGPTSVTLQGRGFGHGHGMSQYGAQGAAEAGLTYRQIAAFYYPGTSWGTATGNISVLISADTTSDVVVGARKGLVLQAPRIGRSWSLHRPDARRWRLVPAAGGARTTLLVLTGGWHVVRTVLGDAQFGAGGAPLRLFVPGGSATYRGVLRSTGSAARDTVNIVSLEAYLRGVVPREMPASWRPAAVQAQAVAARTYAAYERNESLHAGFQVYDDTRDQVYGGAGAEYSASDAAVKATAAKVLTYGGQPAFAQFSASDGGWTAAGGQPYLPARADSYDHYGTWTTTLQAAAIEKAYPALGDFQGFGKITRDGNGWKGGRVETIELLGQKNGRSTAVPLSGDTFRSVFGLKSTLFAPM